MTKHQVLGYQAVENGTAMEFYDGDEMLFIVHISSAETQDQREDLIRTYVMGYKHGKITGAVNLQSKVLNAIGIDGI